MKLDPHFGMLPLGAFKHCGDRRIQLHGGGNPLQEAWDEAEETAQDTFDSANDLVSGAADIVDDAASAVGDAVSGVGEAVVDVVDKAVTAIDNTIQAIADDPLKAAAIAMAVVTQQYYLIPYIQGAAALAHGASPEEALKQAAIAYVAGQAGAGVGAETGSSIAGGSAAGATGAALSGGDVEQGLISGGINAGIGSAAKSISDANFESWAKDQAADTYDNAPSPTEQDVLAADPSIEMDFPLSTPTDATGSGYYNEITGEYISDPIGGLQQPLDDTSGTNLSSMDGYSTNRDTQVTTGPDGKEYDLSNLPKPSYESVSGSDILAPASNGKSEAYDPALTTKEIKEGLKFAKNALFADDQQQARLAGIKTRANSMCLAMGGADKSIPWLNTQEQMLRNQPRMGCASTQDAGAKAPDLQSIYSNLNPELVNEFANRGIGTNFMRGDTPIIGGLEMKGYAAAGSVDSETCSTWGAMGKYMPKFHPVAGSGMLAAGPRRQQSGLAQLKHLYSGISPSGNMGGMAKGGLPSKYHEAAPDGHNPEFVTGLTGYYACGGGTGQSDDIPAMLHDGDYVMDAEAVSALGDGSSKAGRQVLEGFRKQVPHKDGAQGKPVPAKIADGEYVFPSSFVTALGGGDNKKGADILNGLREKLRTHKRSAPTSKIPPKAKSPLDYIKGSKG